jgi:hypothetical protein
MREMWKRTENLCQKHVPVRSLLFILLKLISDHVAVLKIVEKEGLTLQNTVHAKTAKN